MKSFIRFNLIGVIFTLIGILIVFQILRIQDIGDEILIDPYWKEPVTPERGIIYDRNGNQLAGNKKVYELGIELNQVVDAETIALEVSRIFDMEYKDVLSLADMEFNENSARYMVLDDFIEPGKISQLESVEQQYINEKNSGLNGLHWFSYLQRSYPEKFLASNILGFYSFMDRIEGGSHFGVEEAYDNLLSGNPVTVVHPLDPSQISEIANVPPGANLVLTIDREIQAMTEEILEKAVEDNDAISGTIIIMDPETGEVLSMAITPRIDPNEYNKYADLILNYNTYNRAVDMPYEPGSVFKVLTMASALDSNSVEPETEFIDTGVYTIDRQNIYNWDRGAWGVQNMTTCLQHSLNVCLAWIAVEKVGPTTFYEYMNAFGIGHRTNIDLAGEKILPLREPGDEDWTMLSLGNNSFGQGVATTPIQIITAISAIANDGKMMVPHVLKSVITDDNIINVYPRVSGSPITTETARTLTDMLADSLEEEASTALVDGYRVAGKTGTAEIIINGKYDDNLTNASFVGWGPVDDPKFIVYVWIEQPASSPWGSIVAAPIFSDIVENLVILMDIPPDDIRQQLYAQTTD